MAAQHAPPPKLASKATSRKNAIAHAVSDATWAAASEASEAGERDAALKELEERVDDDAASVVTHPLEGEPCASPITVSIPHLRLTAIATSLRGPLLMHAFAQCFDDVISHLSTNRHGQEAVGAFLAHLVDSCYDC